MLTLDGMHGCRRCGPPRGIVVSVPPRMHESASCSTHIHVCLYISSPFLYSPCTCEGEHAAEVLAHSAAMVVYRSEGLSEHIHIALHTTLYYIRTPRKTFHLCERCHACERISGSARVVGVVSLTAGRVSMRRVLVEPAVLGPPSTYFNTCEVDDALEDAESLTLVNERFPGFCPFHIVHNLLGGHYSRSPHCTTAPFSDTMCEHGSHSRPSDAVDQRTHCPAMGAVVFLPLGLSYRAGFPGSLVVGVRRVPILQLWYGLRDLWSPVGWRPAGRGG